MDRHEWIDSATGINLLALPDHDLSSETIETAQRHNRSRPLTVKGCAGREILRLAEEVERLKAVLDADDKLMDEATFAAGQDDGVAAERARIRRGLLGAYAEIEHRLNDRERTVLEAGREILDRICQEEG